MAGRRLAAATAGGALVGLATAALEWWANALAGGRLPWPAAVDLGLLYLGLGALLGLGLGVAGRNGRRAACSGAAASVALTVLASSALRVFAAASSWRALLFFLGAPLYFWAVCRLATRLREDTRSPAALARALLAGAAMVLGTVAAELALPPSRLRQLATVACMLVLPWLAAVLHQMLTDRPPLARWATRRARSAAVALLIGALFAAPALLLSSRRSFAPLRATPARAVAPRDAGSGPDILVVSLDTTRADHLSLYGYRRETTPRLAELARRSLVFTHCVAPSPWTLPSHASLFTGLFPRTHGAILAGRQALAGDPTTAPRAEPDKATLAYPLSAEHLTLAEILSARGYATAAVVANHSYLDRYFGLAQGFEHYDDAPGILLRHPPNGLRLGRSLSRDFLLQPYRGAREITDRALAWLDRERDRPFFLFVNFMEPHAPLVVPRKLRRYAAAGRPSMPWSGEEVDYTRQRGAWSPDEAEAYAALYDDAIRGMDAEIGRLITAIERRAAAERLLIVVLGDHGELLGEHGLVGHIGRMPYEGLVRVPLMVTFPGGAPRGTWEEPVQSLDVFPTVLAAVGLTPAAAVQGQSLTTVAHEIVVEQFVHPALAAADPALFDRETRALYRGRYKLLATSRGELELYDLESDPTETIELSTTLPEVANELRAALAAWQEATPFAARRAPERPSDELIERLRALGYVE